MVILEEEEEFHVESLDSLEFAAVVEKVAFLELFVVLVLHGRLGIDFVVNFQQPLSLLFLRHLGIDVH